MDLIIPILNSINYILVLIMVAMGLVIIFGLMRVINMAHGEFFLIGAYTVVLTDQFSYSQFVIAAKLSSGELVDVIRVAKLTSSVAIIDISPGGCVSAVRAKAASRRPALPW